MLTQVYTGIPHTQRADSVKAAENGTVIESNSKLATEAYQEIIDPTVYNLDFYPYIRMQWDDVQGKNSTVNVLSEHVSQMGLRDIYKISWEQDTSDVNSKYLSAYNVQLRSDQWSVHQRATDGSLGWNSSSGRLHPSAFHQQQQPRLKNHHKTGRLAANLEKRYAGQSVGFHQQSVIRSYIPCCKNGHSKREHGTDH